MPPKKGPRPQLEPKQMKKWMDMMPLKALGVYIIGYSGKDFKHVPKWVEVGTYISIT